MIVTIDYFFCMKLSLQKQLEFCKICKNANYNLQKGLLCKLTDQKPEFEETCSKFMPVSDEVVVPDFKEKKDNLSDQERYIESINTVLSDHYSLSEFHSQKFTREELEVLPEKYKFEYSKFIVFFYNLMGALLIVCSVYLFTKIDNISSNFIYVFGSLFLGLIFSFIGYKRFKNKYSNNYISVNGIYLFDKYDIKWRDVEYIILATTISKKNRSVAIKKHKDEKLYKLFTTENLKLEYDEILRILEMYRQKGLINH